jgi:hypothetical protein
MCDGVFRMEGVGEFKMESGNVYVGEMKDGMYVETRTITTMTMTKRRRKTTNGEQLFQFSQLVVEWSCLNE